ncbi:MAG: HD-GYP domain-containing protein [Thermodesulfobacteriota bacterium]
MQEDQTTWIKIKTEDLRIGMFIVDMGRSWMNHPFLTNKKFITSPKQIEKLKEYGILEVYIDPQKGWVPEGAMAFPNDRTKEDEKIAHFPPEPPSPFPNLSSFSPEEKVPIHQEIKEAKKVHQEAQIIVREVMRDIRLGKNIESAKVKRIVQKMADSIFRNPDALASLTRIKGYDEYTFVHSINVCILCLTLGRHLNLERESLEQLGMGALLHDAGKMKIPNYILQKPGKLSEAEFAEIKKHPLYSIEILEKSEGLSEESKLVALQHHERYAGHGYPSSLQGEEIGKFAQMAAIADVYDAITTNRCYKKAASPYAALQEMYLSANRDFNQFLLERFIQCMGIYPIGTLVQLDTQEIGLVCSVNHQQLLRPHVLLLFKNPKQSYRHPIVADLMEKDNASGSFKRTILKPLNAQKWNICVDDYLAAAAWGEIIF